MYILSSLSFCAALVTTTTAFVPSFLAPQLKGTTRLRTATSKDRVSQHLSVHYEDRELDADILAPSRRGFLSQATAGAALLTFCAQEAFAADSGVISDLSKINNSANKRIGGLSNKIRNIARVMVSLFMMDR
jgi:hypothetical protein